MNSISQHQLRLLPDPLALLHRRTNVSEPRSLNETPLFPSDPHKLGWKDKIRVSPLKDTYVAVPPIIPTIPFGVPDSVGPQVVIAPEALATHSVLTASSYGALTWTDPTPVDLADPTSWTLTGAAAGTAEIGCTIQRADVLPGGGAGECSEIGTALANATTFAVPTSASTGFYRVVAWTAAGETPSRTPPWCRSPRLTH